MQGMSGISFAAAAQPGAITSGDPVERGLRKQISELKKQLGELSLDASLTAEEKVRRQQELRKQITELENQIRQHQMEQRMEK